MGNAGRLDLYFLAVAAMSTANTALFLWPVASRYAYIPPGAEGFGSSDDGSVVGKGKGGPAERAPSPFRLALPLSTATVDPDALPSWSRATSRAGSSEGSAHGGSATLARLRTAALGPLRALAARAGSPPSDGVEIALDVARRTTVHGATMHGGANALQALVRGGGEEAARAARALSRPRAGRRAATRCTRRGCRVRRPRPACGRWPRRQRGAATGATTPRRCGGRAPTRARRGGSLIFRRVSGGRAVALFSSVTVRVGERGARAGDATSFTPRHLAP